MLSKMCEAQMLHACLVKNGLQCHVFRCNLLLDAYVKSGALSDAHKLFHLMPFTNVVSHNTLLSGYVRFRRLDDALQLFANSPETDARSFNTIISGCVSHQRSQEAIAHFIQMTRTSIRPDGFTYASLAPACDFDLGRQLHSQIFKICSCFDVFLTTNLVRMYGNLGKFEFAHQLFDEMPERDLVVWNTLISCYSRFGSCEETLKLFCRMVREGVEQDEYTFSSVLNVFASHLAVVEAMQVHSLLIRYGLCFDLFTINVLLDLYCKCGFMSSAAKLFDEMPERNVVSWTAMIVGLSQNGSVKKAIEMFHLMQLSGVKPNSFTFGGLLSACASACAFEKGKQLHGYVLKYGMESQIVASAIVNMYSKCGGVDDALKLFRAMDDKDLICWNGMICAYAHNGEAEEALNLFEEMMNSEHGIKPNQVTFLSVLSACSHGGLVNEGQRYFYSMIHDHQIKPKVEHYACMVDLFGRAGLLEEAEAMMLDMPFEPDGVMWSALLGACRRHGNLIIARRIAEQLFAIERKISSSYVLLSSMYSEIGEWGDALGLREVMNSRGAPKMTGCSWIEIRNNINAFIAGDQSHPQIELIYEVLERLYLQILELGVPV